MSLARHDVSVHCMLCWSGFVGLINQGSTCYMNSVLQQRAAFLRGSLDGICDFFLFVLSVFMTPRFRAGILASSSVATLPEIEKVAFPVMSVSHNIFVV